MNDTFKNITATVIIVGAPWILSYYELWSVLSQWKGEFSTREFTSTFVSPDHNKVLHDMTKKGLLEKVGRGRFRVTTQKDYVMMRSNIEAGYETVRSAGLPYVLSGPDAVWLWTRGGYNADRFFGCYPIWLKVRRNNLRKWKSFLHSQGQKCVVDGKPPGETLFGVFFVLRPVGELKGAEVGGYTVESLKEAVRFCQENVYTYEPALEILDEMYNLGLGVQHREV